MTSPNLMALVRELKGLNAKKKAGTALTEAENKRRKELKTYLKTALEQQKQNAGAMGATSEGPAVSNLSASGMASMRSAESSAPKSVPLGRAGSQESSAPKPAPAAAPTPAKAAARNAFAIDAGGLFEEAEKSKAVANSVKMEKGPGAVSAPPPGMRSIGKNEAGAVGGGVDLTAQNAGFTPTGKASSTQLDEMFAKADAAARAHQRGERSNDPTKIIAELEEKEAAYTPREEAFALEDYYGEHFEAGYEFVEDDTSTGLEVIDPRDLEMHKAGLGGSSSGVPSEGTIDVAVPAGLAFIDDFEELYLRGVLPNPEDEEEPDLEDPNLLIPGRRKVTVHMLNGSSKRGVIRKMSKGDLGFTLEPLGTGRSEDISMGQIKALFIQRPTRGTPIEVHGPVVTVTFKDRRKIQGQSNDYQPGARVFTLIPPAGKGQFERIIVNGGSVLQVQ